MPSSPRSQRSPLEGADRLVVDGTNLLHRLARGGAPPAAAIGRLRAVVPAAISIDLVFDGMGHGVTGRVAQGMHVRYSGRRPADEMILDLAGPAEAAAGDPGVLVVTDDRGLRARLLARGVRSVPLVWLVNRLDLPVLASPAAGNRRATLGAGTPATIPGGDDETERPGWKPGRGATAKTGPARRVPRHRRHPRHSP